jgi:dGTPase
MIATIAVSGEIALSSQAGAVLARMRAFNYAEIYMRDESVQQAQSVISVLGQLVEYYMHNPTKLPDMDHPIDDHGDMALAAVAYVSGMTDRFAFQKAIELISYDPARLPRGIDFSL